MNHCSCSPLWMCSISVGRCVKTTPQSSHWHVTLSSDSSSTCIGDVWRNADLLYAGISSVFDIPSASEESDIAETSSAGGFGGCASFRCRPWPFRILDNEGYGRTRDICCSLAFVAVSQRPLQCFYINQNCATST